MKTNLRFALLIISTAIFHLTYGQVTKLSNNTSLSGLLVNNKALFVSDVDNTLWTSDGTLAGTLKFTNKVTGDSTDNAGYGFLGGKVYFSGINAANGSELWVTDGTDAGTSLIKDIESGTASSTPTNFFQFNNQLFFFATTAATGSELWKTDGTTNGSVMVKDINPGAGSSNDDGGNSLNYFINNGVLYFSANDGAHGTELWRTDGTTNGTVMVKDINQGAGDGITSFGSSILGQTIALGTITLFKADDGSGSQLWKTDGTEAGTVMVKAINSGPLGGLPTSFVAFNNKIYFSANTENEGSELWVTDGTAAGTNIVKDIYPGAESSSPSLFNSIIFGNRLVFSATDSALGTELWSTDGTEQGTILLKDINIGTGDSDPFLLANLRTSDLSFSFSHTPPFNGKVFFTAITSGGAELWITDGTASGTVMLKNINSSAQNLLGYFYTANTLFFNGDDGNTGSELWKSDGTTTGTGLVADINPGKGSSDPTFNFVFNNRLYFTADDGDNNGDSTDLFIVDENVTLPVSLYNFAATALPTKAVKLEWNTTNELNSSHFDIERSADGINFSKINEVKAAGNSALNQRYQYTDEQPVHLRNPVLYYRLKMVDKDAAFKYSRILAVHFNQSSFEFSFSPNPVQNQLSVVVAAAGAKTIALRVTDASGKLIYQQKLSSAQTINQQNINVSAWQNGIYYIQLITDTSVKTEKFVKQ